MAKEQLINLVEGWETELRGKVQDLCKIIEDVAVNLNVTRFSNIQKVEAKLVNQDDRFIHFDIFLVLRDNAQRKLVGVITLETINDKHTILRVPPKSQWIHRVIGEDKVRDIPNLRSYISKFMSDFGLNLPEKDIAPMDINNIFVANLVLFSEYLVPLQKRLKKYSLKRPWYKLLM